MYGDPPVPFTLNLEPDESLLLVSGPNAGGKTVLLKSIGLLSAMAQSGIVPPVADGTVLPCFSDFFAVIGDEQSIDASLSTFSAHLVNLRQILETAGGRSLVLVDELGSHTDPEEGAALAAVVLERLVGQTGLTVATTHLGALKALAGERPGIVNASMEFDSEEIRPTFRFRRDRPGRSYALQIADRLGMPPELLAAARDRLSDLDRAMDELLADLESRQAELEALMRVAETREVELAREGEALAARRTLIERREAELERSARRAEEKYVRAARTRVEDAVGRLEEEYAVVLSELRSKTAEVPIARVRSADEELTAAKRAARSVVERAVREAGNRPETAREAEALPALAPGVKIRIRGLNRVATVEEVRGDRVTLDAEGLRLTVPATELEAIERLDETTGEDRVAGGPETGRRASTAEVRPVIHARAEVDLRGLRVDEVEPALLPAIDAAIVADLPALRIIHGKGTGAVRAEVKALLEGDERIPNHRPGGPGEGGEGVTVIEFASRRESGNG
jgi:DNA mismatch repair protein MutS2